LEGLFLGAEHVFSVLALNRGTGAHSRWAEDWGGNGAYLNLLAFISLGSAALIRASNGGVIRARSLGAAVSGVSLAFTISAEERLVFGALDCGLATFLTESIERTGLAASISTEVGSLDWASIDGLAMTHIFGTITVRAINLSLLALSADLSAAIDGVNTVTVKALNLTGFTFIRLLSVILKSASVGLVDGALVRKEGVSVNCLAFGFTSGAATG
jgi:hypothetical protein